MIGGLILVRSAGRRRGRRRPGILGADFSPPAGARPLGRPARDGGRRGLEARDRAVAGVGGKHRRGTGQADRRRLEPPVIAASAGVRRRSRTAGAILRAESSDRAAWPTASPSGRRCPWVPAEACVRQHDFTLCETDRGARAAAYLASRLAPYTRASTVAVAESTQKGIVTFGHAAAEAVRRRARGGRVPAPVGRARADDGACPAAERAVAKLTIIADCRLVGST